jgi:hypothetical protein
MRQGRLVMKASFIGFCIFIIIMMMEASVCLAMSCNFTQTTSTLPFGNLDPSSAASATSVVTIGIICSGSQGTWFMTSDDGLYYNGATKRMRHQTVLTEYLPYTVTFSPTTGNKFSRTITASGTILNSSYINAYVGDYADRVTLTITP